VARRHPTSVAWCGPSIRFSASLRPPLRGAPSATWCATSRNAWEHLWRRRTRLLAPAPGNPMSWAHIADHYQRGSLTRSQTPRHLLIADEPSVDAVDRCRFPQFRVTANTRALVDRVRRVGRRRSERVDLGAKARSRFTLLMERLVIGLIHQCNTATAPARWRAAVRFDSRCLHRPHS